MRYVNHNKNPFQVSSGFAVPFFLVLAVLTVVSFIIPLRPTRSESEKRNLAEFPEFSLEALASGSYFDDITTWFSDTFPGREEWLRLSGRIDELHGHSNITIHGDITIQDPGVTVPETTLPETTAPIPTTAPEATVPSETVPTTAAPTETEVPPTDPVEVWGGLHAGDANVDLGAVIQIDNYAFNYFSFSEYTSERYATLVNRFAETVADKDVNIVSAPAPTAVGVMVESAYMELLKCAPQDEALDYIHSLMDESVVKVDTVRALIEHNDEYLFYRTDHHWSSIGAYYAYAAIMEALGHEPAALEDFEPWDQGTFRGSLYYKCNQTSKLELDTVTAFIPEGDIVTRIYKNSGGGSGFEWPLLTDMSKNKENSKYMCFLAGDHAMTKIVNNSLPDAPNCVLVKDSYGNCLAPFLTQNYHTVYVLDYREYTAMKLSQFIETNNIQDVILLPNLGATQSSAVCDLMGSLCK